MKDQINNQPATYELFGIRINDAVQQSTTGILGAFTLWFANLIEHGNPEFARGGIAYGEDYEAGSVTAINKAVDALAELRPSQPREDHTETVSNLEEFWFDALNYGMELIQDECRNRDVDYRYDFCANAERAQALTIFAASKVLDQICALWEYWFDGCHEGDIYMSANDVYIFVMEGCQDTISELDFDQDLFE